jgi:polygalacturonase
MNTNVLDFGAIADGITLNTAAVQSAIDACAASGGGRVTVPVGRYKLGTVWLRSGVELHLEMGAELFASENMDDYNETNAYEQNFDVIHEGWVGKHLIIAHEVENVAITGFGTVNGNLYAFVDRVDTPVDKVYGWCHGVSRLKDAEKMRPGQLICFIECKGVCVQDISIVDSPCWSCFIHGCEYVQIRGVKIQNPIWMLNSDGIDIDASRYVTVSDCIIETGDDAITLRACEARLKNKDMHCEYVTVTNCVLSTGICAFRIGVGTGVIRHARIHGIVIRGALNIVQLCTAYGEKGKADIEDVNFSDISAENTDRLLQAFAKNGAYIRNISMENIRTTAAVQSAIEVMEGSIENLSLRNIEVCYRDKCTDLSENQYAFRGEHLLRLFGAKDVTLENFHISGTMYGVKESVCTQGCDGLTKRNCNF